MRQSYTFLIDLLGLGQCNLRCPSCPISNSKIKNPNGFMSPELMYEILAKATSECHISHVFLFNWTEPLLNPKLPEIIQVVNQFSVPCYLSSNLNIKRDFKEILVAKPAFIKISVSGFHQAIYERSHKGGNIEVVKENMKQLSQAKKELQSNTVCYVIYHRYLGNLDDERLMQEYAASLGFYFGTSWAYFMNLEKQLAWSEGNKSVLTSEDLEIISKMVIPFWEGVDLVEPYKHQNCKLRDEQIVLDHQGNVMLCCAVYDTNKYIVSNFLDTSLTEIQRLKSQNLTCVTCMKHGYHAYGVYGSDVECSEITIPALDRVGEYYAQQLGIF